MYKNHIGIMQGRLSPRYNGRYQAFPPENWKDEFPVAKSLGFDCIEFIYDYENYETSPLTTDRGLEEIRKISSSSSVKVFSICADFFMRNLLFNKKEEEKRKNIALLKNLIIKSSAIGITDITLPFVDESSLKDKNDMDNAKASIQEILPVAERCRVNINLETDLPPDEFNLFFKDLNHPAIKINYDIGNSASLGYNPEEEMDLYGADVSVLHVKDRLYKGGSVKLGTGNANFEVVFRKLKEVNFKSLIIMQAARAEHYADERAYVEEQFVFLKTCLERWFV